MSIKTILVHVTADAAGTRNLDAACLLAQTFDAHVEGVHVIDVNLIPSLASPYARIPQEVIDMRRKADENAAKKAKSSFQARMEKEGLSSEWRLARGEPRHEIARQARYADLVILAQADPEDTVASAISLPADVILLSGLPVLMTPAKEIKTLGKRVLLAWNGSAQSARAAHDALPILKKSKDVMVLSVGKGDAGRLSADNICAHLARHGVRVTADYAEDVSRPEEDVLLSAVKAHGADLVVAGAWGHSRLREMILGGVTKSLLQRAPVPVLFSH